MEGARPGIRAQFGFAVTDRREAPGLTREEFAARAGIHRTYLLDIERGPRNVSLLNIERLAQALGLEISELFQLVERPRSARARTDMPGAGLGRRVHAPLRIVPEPANVAVLRAPPSRSRPAWPVPVRDGIVPHRPSHALPRGRIGRQAEVLGQRLMRRAIRRLLAGDRADRTAVDADVALGAPALAPGMLDRPAAPGLREDHIKERGWVNRPPKAKVI